MSIGNESSVAARPDTTPGATLLRKPDAPTHHEHQLLVERRRAEANGYELPLDSREAATYADLSMDTLISLAIAGQIPALPAGEDSWIFCISELNDWLATHGKPIAEDAAQVSDRAERGPEDEEC